MVAGYELAGIAGVLWRMPYGMVLSERSDVEIEFVVQERIDPLLSVALDRHFMRSVARHSRAPAGVLRVYECAGDFLSLGRYNLAPSLGAKNSGFLSRRHSGGRALPCGEGFVGLSLVLPHRSAFFSSDPFHLAPHQVINRYVRGLLEACNAFGIAAFYPGRDLVTVGRRALAAVSFETDERGTLLFEGLIGNERDFGGRIGPLARELEEETPLGEIARGLEATSLRSELGARLAVGQVAEEIRRGFARQFSLSFRERKLSSLELQAVQALANRRFGAERWLLERRLDPALDRRGQAAIQLGRLEVHLSLQGRGVIKNARLFGDFIANSGAVSELERALRLCPANWSALEAVVSGVFSKPQNFVLGIGRLRTIVDTIMRGAGS